MTSFMSTNSLVDDLACCLFGISTMYMSNFTNQRFSELTTLHDLKLEFIDKLN